MKKIMTVAIAVMMAMIFVGVVYSQATNQPATPNLTEDQQNKLIVQNAKKTSELKKDVADVKTQLDPQGPVVFTNGSTIKGLRTEDKKNSAAIAEVSKRLAFAMDPQVILRVVGMEQENIDCFLKLDPSKPEEAAKREITLVAALKKLAKPDWSSLEAQGAIKAWVETNILGSKTLEEVMGKNSDGKINTDAVALLDTAYAPKKGFDNLKTGLDGYKVNIQDAIGKLSGRIDANALDIAVLSQVLDWKEITGEDGKTYQVPVAIKRDMLVTPMEREVNGVASLLANAPKNGKGDAMPMASATSVELKADKTEIDRLETKINTVREAVAAVGLGEEDRALVYIYASFVQESNADGFKNFLKAQGEEKKFDSIKKAAEKLAASGNIKLPGIQATQPAPVPVKTAKQDK